VLVGITTGGKIGLGAVALAFIGFALLVSFVFPRRNPDFPGERLRSFIWVTVLLFVAMMTAVVVFAREEESEAHGGETVAHETTETGETGETGETNGEEPPPAAEGDAAAGEDVFAANGCGSCHALEAAGATGAVGPNLDESQPDFELVVDRVTNGMGAMPAFGDSLSEEQIADVAAYVVESTSG
jgi:mono/diheme cytochrome c family protein